MNLNHLYLNVHVFTLVRMYMSSSWSKDLVDYITLIFCMVLLKTFVNTEVIDDRTKLAKRQHSNWLLHSLQNVKHIDASHGIHNHEI